MSKNKFQLLLTVSRTTLVFVSITGITNFAEAGNSMSGMSAEKPISSRSRAITYCTSIDDTYVETRKKVHEVLEKHKEKKKNKSTKRSKKPAERTTGDIIKGYKARLQAERRDLEALDTPVAEVIGKIGGKFFKNILNLDSDSTDEQEEKSKKTWFGDLL